MGFSIANHPAIGDPPVVESPSELFLVPWDPCESRGQTVSFSSPEFRQLLPEMDEKMVPIKHAEVKNEEKNPRLMDSKS